MSVKITIESQDGKKTSHKLTKRTTTIGRGPDNDLVIERKSVSTRHALLKEEEDGSHFLKDLNSTNGTEVNGERIQKIVLKDGDAFTLGNVKGTYHTGISEGASKKPVVPSAIGSVAKSENSKADQLQEARGYQEKFDQDDSLNKVGLEKITEAIESLDEKTSGWREGPDPAAMVRSKLKQIHPSLFKENTVRAKPEVFTDPPKKGTGCVGMIFRLLLMMVAFVGGLSWHHFEKTEKLLPMQILEHFTEKKD